jgi:hypothetical protein
MTLCLSIICDRTGNHKRRPVPPWKGFLWRIAGPKSLFKSLAVETYNVVSAIRASCLGVKIAQNYLDFFLFCTY